MKYRINFTAIGFMLLFHTALMAQGVKDTGRLYFHLSPAFLSSYNMYLGVQPGLQYHYKNWAAAAEVAFPLFYNTKKDLEKDQYHRFGLEVKKYRSKVFANAKRYHSLQVNYTIRNFYKITTGSFQERTTDDSISLYDKARIHSPVLAVALKTGRTYQLKKGFMLDVFAGVGLRRIATSYSDVLNLRRDRYGRKDLTPFPPSAYKYDLTLTRLHATAGFRLGVQIK